MDQEEWNAQQQALYDAVNTFYNTLNKHGFDGAYWSLRIQVRRISTDFTSVLDETVYDDYAGHVEGG